MLFSALVYSHVHYGIEVYGMATSSILKPLSVICNRTLRLLQNKKIDTSIKSLYIDYDILKIDLLFHLKIGILVYRSLFCKSSIPASISNIFDTGKINHSYFTRVKNSNDLCLYNSNFISKNLYSYVGGKLWNNI